MTNLLYAILFFSGFAGLGYEMVFTRMLSVGLGHEIPAVLAVVAAFFSGMALGAWLLDKPLAASRRPGLWYAGLELSIGLWAVMLIALIPWFNTTVAPALLGLSPSPVRHWFLAFAMPLALLLPSTFAMGATLPALERLLSRMYGEDRRVGGLYAANTLGAVAGTLAAAFVIVPALGFRATLMSLAAVNLACGLGVLALRLPAQDAAQQPDSPSVPPRTQPLPGLYILLLCTGLLGIGYEVLAIRVLSQVLENTIYSFAGALAVYLAGTAAGAGVYQRFAALAWARPKRTMALLLQLLALACAAGTAVLAAAPQALQVLHGWLSAYGAAGALGAELLLAALVLILPTLVMGAAFSHLAQAATGAAGGLGRALAVNTLGSSLAPVIFGVLLLPWMGPKNALLAVAGGYLVLLLPLAAGLQRRSLIPAAVPALALAAIALGPVGVQHVTLPAGSRILAHKEGVMAAVTVTEDQRGGRHLKVNDKFRMGGTSWAYSDLRQGNIPLLLHPDPKRALFLGLGTGLTFAATADHPGLAADGVELVPEVVDVMPLFAGATGDLTAHGGRLRVHAADARRFVSAGPGKYDVVVADLFHPARDGAGSLYTVEHFQAVGGLLNPGGIFCQWLPLYQLDLDTLKTIIRSYLAVFPDATAWLAHYSLQTPIIGLMTGVPEDGYSPKQLAQRLDGPFGGKLRSIRLDNVYELLGTFLASPRDLAAFAGPGPLNADDLPRVVFEAPRFAYGNTQPAHERLMRFLSASHPVAKDILAGDAPADAAKRLEAHWRARVSFLLAGLQVRQQDDMVEFIRQASGPLLDIVRQSPDFGAAYEPLLQMAYALGQKDHSAAMALLRKLEEAAPQRAEASALRRRLAGS